MSAVFWLAVIGQVKILRYSGDKLANCFRNTRTAVFNLNPDPFSP